MSDCTVTLVHRSQGDVIDLIGRTKWRACRKFTFELMLGCKRLLLQTKKDP